MLVISYGIPKSGSTLAFELIRGILENAGHPQEVVHNSRTRGEDGGEAPKRNFLAKADREIVAGLIAKIGPGRIIAVKSHARLEREDFAWFEERQRAGELKVIASFRDPRDVALSLVDAGRKSRELHGGDRAFARIGDLDQALRRVEKRIKDFRRWAALEGTLRLNYEDVAFQPDKAIAAVEQALGLSADHDAVKRHAFDEASTQRNKGVSRRHEQELDEAQAKILRRRFRSFLRNVCERDQQRWFDICRERVLHPKAPPAGDASV
ncbi:MAG: sulfotransferase domain-containing protein [Alphaproteobacteria bacterium]|nr:sulfotransferase domain-containing protein [Alphaproteobacteria bacterium]